ncbi:exodeoxyribonuclease VII small subunit [Coriobacteriales bacterium OH1046]|nr:exodeoxyribonuclease VII small subunit [Coriobacteriales bacterium OH1046]
MDETQGKNIEQMSFKEASVELEQIVRSLETGDLELEDALETYTRGVALLKSLKTRIAEAEQKVRKLLEDGTPAEDSSAE